MRRIEHTICAGAMETLLLEKTRKLEHQVTTWRLELAQTSGVTPGGLLISFLLTSWLMPNLPMELFPRLTATHALQGRRNRLQQRWQTLKLWSKKEKASLPASRRTCWPQNLAAEQSPQRRPSWALLIVLRLVVRPAAEEGAQCCSQTEAGIGVQVGQQT